MYIVKNISSKLNTQKFIKRILNIITYLLFTNIYTTKIEKYPYLYFTFKNYFRWINSLYILKKLYRLFKSLAVAVYYLIGGA
jgi:hypothetical protein